MSNWACFISLTQNIINQSLEISILRGVLVDLFLITGNFKLVQGEGQYYEIGRQ
jgi:hypothetical protein